MLLPRVKSISLLGSKRIQIVLILQPSYHCCSVLLFVSRYVFLMSNLGQGQTVRNFMHQTLIIAPLSFANYTDQNFIPIG